MWRYPKLELALIVAIWNWKAVSRCQILNYARFCEPDVHLIGVESLIYEQVLRADSKDLFHVDLGDTIDIEFTRLMSVIIPQIVFLAPHLIQVHMIQRDGHATKRGVALH